MKRLGRHIFALTFVTTSALSTGYASAQSLADSQGNVYTVGSFSGTVDFDPGPGMFHLTAAGTSDLFVSKLASNGNFRWARRLGGGRQEFSDRAVLERNLYIQGYSVSTEGEEEILIAKVTPAGQIAWTRRYEVLFPSPARVGLMAVDTAGGVITAGSLAGPVDFDPGPGSFVLSQCCDVVDNYVAKLDSSGRFVWAAALHSGEERNEIKGLEPGPFQTLNITASVFNGTFDLPSGQIIMNSVNLPECEDRRCDSLDVYIVKVDGRGNLIRMKQFGGSGNERVNGG